MNNVQNKYLKAIGNKSQFETLLYSGSLCVKNASSGYTSLTS